MNNSKDKIDWPRLSANPDPRAIKLLIDDNQYKIDWDWLSSNTAPGALELLSTRQDKIDWVNLSSNTAPEAVELLLKNQLKIDWDYLSSNSAPEALELLAANPDKINWDYLSANPGLFEVIELIEVNEHLGQRQRFAFSKLISNTSRDIIQKILQDKPEPTRHARVANITNNVWDVLLDKYFSEQEHDDRVKHFEKMKKRWARGFASRPTRFFPRRRLIRKILKENITR